jgi:hypothetical protein
MNVTSVKQAFGLAAAAVGTAGAMMLAPAVANAATAQPAHVQAVSHMQTVSNISRASGGWDGGFFDGCFKFHHCCFFPHFWHFHHCCWPFFV